VSADQPAAPAPTVIYGPHCSHDDCGWITCDESGLVEFCCNKPDCPHCGGSALRNTPEDWADDPARFAAMTPAEQDRARAYWARYPLRRRGPDDTAERADRDLAEWDEWACRGRGRVDLQRCAGRRVSADHPWWCEACPSPTICAPAGRCAERRSPRDRADAGPCAEDAEDSASTAPGAWHCEAYGPDGARFGALCFAAGDGERTCADQAECGQVMTAERQRVFRAISERAAAGDPTMAYLEGEFSRPEQILGGGTDE